MSGLEGQISIFTLLEGYDAPHMPFEACKAGVIAWTIECTAITNSWDSAAPVLYLAARPRKIRFKADSKKDQYGWSLYYDSVGGPGEYFGGWGSRCEVFVNRPTDADCERFTRERYGKDKRITAETPFRMWI